MRLVKIDNDMTVFAKNDQGHEVYRLESPPSLTQKDLDKLEKTAYHLREIGKMWNIPDRGLEDLSIIGIDPSAKEDDNDACHDAILHNWYQKQPFIPLFFNKQMHDVIKARMIELEVKEREKE